MPLTPDQINAVRVLDWLLDDSEQSRRTGRSITMAVALIRKALRYPGRSVFYMDHVAGMSQRQEQNLCRLTIEGLIHRDPVLARFGWRVLSDRFSVLVDITDVLPHDWWPTDLFNSTGPTPVREVLEQQRQIHEMMSRAKFVEDPHRRSAWERLNEGEPFSGT